MSIAKHLDPEYTSKLRDFWYIVHCICLHCPHLFQAPRTLSMQAGQRLARKIIFCARNARILTCFSEPEARQCQTREIFSMFLPDIYGSLKLAGYLIYRPSLSTCVHPSVIYPSIHPLTVYHPSSWASRLCPLSCISCSLFFLASLFICWFSMV